MTEKEFKEAMHTIAGREDSGQYYNYAEKMAKKRKVLRTGIICGSIAAAVIIVVTLGIVLGRMNAVKTPKTYDFDNDTVLANPTEQAGPVTAPTEQKGPTFNPTEGPTADPTEEPTKEPTKLPDPTPVPTEEPTKEPTKLPDPTSVPTAVPTEPVQETPGGNNESYIAPSWFSKGTLKLMPLLYKDLSRKIDSLRPPVIGADLIPTTVLGEHEDCPGVFYDPANGSIICLYHEFLEASGVTIPDSRYIEFKLDRVRGELTAVRIYDKNSVRTTDLWMFDRSASRAWRVPLPEGAASYDDINVYSNGLWNGRLCVSVNGGDNAHFISVYDVDNGSYTKVADNSNGSWISGEFIAENIIIISSDGYAFYNMDKGITIDVIGEYNYYANGKVYSVKNNGWALHTEVEVAAYNAATGAKLKNQSVLVRTVLDDGTRVFLVKDSTTGEENVILRNYDYSCYTWSRDYNYFYAFSSAEKRILCYSAADGNYFTNPCSGISVEPVVRDGKNYKVYAEYALAVADNNQDVYIYYTRTLEEMPDIPAYENEKVDSPYWDTYREIKFVNFDKEKVFFVGHKEDIVGAARISRECYDMTVLRDFILKCLEQRGDIIDPQLVENRMNHLNTYIFCGSFMMDVFDVDGRYYVSMSGKPCSYYGKNGIMFEIPEALFREMAEFMHFGYIFDRANQPLFYEDGALDPIFEILRSDGRWETDEMGGMEGIDYIIYVDGRMFVYYSSIGKVYKLTGGMTYTILTAEEKALFDSILSNPIVY